MIAHSGNIGEVDASPKNALGMVMDGADSSGASASFVYLEGAADTVIGSVVTYDEAGKTALLADGASGPVAVATAATGAGTYGWFGKDGTFPTAVVASCADNAAIGREGADGTVGDGATVFISNAISRGESPAEMPDPPVLTLVQMKNPFVMSPPTAPVGTRRAASKAEPKEKESRSESKDR